jgi:hypothetical protein
MRVQGRLRLSLFASTRCDSRRLRVPGTCFRSSPPNPSDSRTAPGRETDGSALNWGLGAPHLERVQTSARFTSAST